MGANCCGFASDVDKSHEIRRSSPGGNSTYYQNPNALTADRTADREKVAEAAEKRLGMSSGKTPSASSSKKLSSSTSVQSPGGQDEAEGSDVPVWLRLLTDGSAEVENKKETSEEIDLRRSLINNVDLYFRTLAQALSSTDTTSSSSPLTTSPSVEERLKQEDWFSLQQRANRLPLPQLKSLVNDLRIYTGSIKGSNPSLLNKRDPEKDVLIALINLHDNGRRGDLNYFTMHKKSIGELRHILRDLRQSSSIGPSPAAVDRFLVDS